MSTTLLSDSSGEPVIWLHKQSFPESGDRRHGRLWLHFWDNTLGIEWALKPKRFSIGIECFDRACGDENLLLFVVVPYLFALYVTIKNFPPITRLPGAKWLRGNFYSGHREISLRYDPKENHCIHWRLWRNPHISNSRDWRDGGLFFDDVIFGNRKYSTSDIETRAVAIDMPERSYAATARHYIATWTRKRWCKPVSISRVEIDIPGGIATSGHGENGWDMDDDAVFNFTTLADTIEQAIEQLRLDVLRERKKYGNDEWPPEQ